MVTESDVNELVDKVEKVTKQRKMDLTSDADLSGTSVTRHER